MKIQKPTIGRIVEVAFAPKGCPVQSLPGVVTAAFPNGLCNIKPFDDGSNTERSEPRFPTHVYSAPHNADGQVPEGQTCSWRYPPRCTDEIEV